MRRESLLALVGWFLITNLLAAAEPVPPYASRPGSPHTLYLDFDGERIPYWHGYHNLRCQQFDIDNDYQTFSQTERAMIREIFERVAEDYAPFDLNVTTIDPGHVDKVAHLVIGGATSDWYRYQAGDGMSYAYQCSGVAEVSGFYETNSAKDWKHYGFTFTDNLHSFHKVGLWTKSIAESASHEAGHLFGLHHLPPRDKHGNRLADQSGRPIVYDRGTDEWGPLMGIGFYSRRTTWHKALNEKGVPQDDLAALTEGLGLVPDDYADNAADALPLVGPLVEIQGLINHEHDIDLFHFRTQGGGLTLWLRPAEYGPNLIAKLQVQNLAGEVLAETTTTDKQPLVVDLNRGIYYVSITGTGGYANLGRYRVQGEIYTNNGRAGPSTLRSRAMQFAVLH
jgi:hypothetical protein